MTNAHPQPSRQRWVNFPNHVAGKWTKPSITHTDNKYYPNPLRTAKKEILGRLNASLLATEGFTEDIEFRRSLKKRQLEETYGDPTSPNHHWYGGLTSKLHFKTKPITFRTVKLCSNHHISTLTVCPLAQAGAVKVEWVQWRNVGYQCLGKGKYCTPK